MNKGVLNIKVSERRRESLNCLGFHVFIFLVALVKDKAHSIARFPAESAPQLSDSFMKGCNEGISILHRGDFPCVVGQ